MIPFILAQHGEKALHATADIDFMKNQKGIGKVYSMCSMAHFVCIYKV